MDRTGHLRLMARYNAWVNDRLLEVAGKLPAEALTVERGADFGSILGTLNRLIVGDTVWLKRFAAHPNAWRALGPMVTLPEPQSLDERPFDSLHALAVRRELLDRTIEAWIETLTDADCDSALKYTSERGNRYSRQVYPLLVHFFNRQTHHRGQTATLLSQAGVEVGSIDLVTLIPQTV